MRFYTYRDTVISRMTPALKMGSDESHFNVSLIVRDKDKDKYPQTKTSEKKGELTQIRTEVPLLTSLLTSLVPYRWAKPAHRPSNLTPVN